MKMNLFASVAIAAVMAVTAPAHAQILGGGLRGSVSGMQGATFGDGFGNMRAFARDQAVVSASGHVGGRVDAMERVGKTARIGTRDAVRSAETTKADAQATGHGAVEFAASEATKAGNKARTAVVNEAADSSQSTREQARVPASNLNAGDEFAGRLSAREALGTRPDANTRTQPASGQTAPIGQDDSHGAAPPRHAPTKEHGAASDSDARATADARGHGETRGTAVDARASGSVNASASP